MEINPGLMSFLPLVLIGCLGAILGYKLAKDKGRNIRLWTILGLIPFINVFCIWYFIGATNHRLEQKVDRLIELNSSKE